MLPLFLVAAIILVVVWVYILTHPKSALAEDVHVAEQTVAEDAKAVEQAVAKDAAAVAADVSKVV